MKYDEFLKSYPKADIVLVYKGLVEIILHSNGEYVFVHSHPVCRGITRETLTVVAGKRVIEVYMYRDDGHEYYAAAHYEVYEGDYRTLNEDNYEPSKQMCIERYLGAMPEKAVKANVPNSMADKFKAHIKLHRLEGELK